MTQELAEKSSPFYKDLARQVEQHKSEAKNNKLYINSIAERTYYTGNNTQSQFFKVTVSSNNTYSMVEETRVPKR